jgi:hypothetical protein
MKTSRVQRQRRLMGAAVLLLLLLRAYVPLGFMPGGSGFLALQICPEGLPQHVHHLHHGDHGHDAFEHCPFGSAPAAGPAPSLVSLPPQIPKIADASIQSSSAAFGSRSERSHPPTGPPFLS